MARPDLFQEYNESPLTIHTRLLLKNYDPRYRSSAAQFKTQIASIPAKRGSMDAETRD